MQKPTFKNKSFTHKQAFTLIELLIVIAIIGILFIVLVSKVDFATDKAKASGVQTDFRSFQLAFETVAKEHQGFSSLVDEDYEQLEMAINKNLDNKLKINIDAMGNITMANGATDPWGVEYHGQYVTGDDGKDRGAIVMYSNGANLTFGSDISITGGIASINTINEAGKDDYSVFIIYSLANNYGEIKIVTSGFSNNMNLDNTNDNAGNVSPDIPNTPDNDITEDNISDEQIMFVISYPYFFSLDEMAEYNISMVDHGTVNYGTTWKSWCDYINTTSSTEKFFCQDDGIYSRLLSTYLINDNGAIVKQTDVIEPGVYYWYGVYETTEFDGNYLWSGNIETIMDLVMENFEGHDDMYDIAVNFKILVDNDEYAALPYAIMTTIENGIVYHTIGVYINELDTYVAYYKEPAALLSSFLKVELDDVREHEFLDYDYVKREYRISAENKTLGLYQTYYYSDGRVEETLALLDTMVDVNIYEVSENDEFVILKGSSLFNIGDQYLILESLERYDYSDSYVVYNGDGSWSVNVNVSEFDIDWINESVFPYFECVNGMITLDMVHIAEVCFMGAFEVWAESALVILPVSIATMLS